MGICPFDPYGISHGLGSISLNPFNGFAPFEVLWNFIDLYLRNDMVVYPFAPNGLVHEPNHESNLIPLALGSTFVDPISLKPLQWIYTVWSSIELPSPVAVQCCDHLPICPTWACPWTKTLLNIVPAGLGDRVMHISETLTEPNIFYSYCN